MPLQGNLCPTLFAAVYERPLKEGWGLLLLAFGALLWVLVWEAFEEKRIVEGKRVVEGKMLKGKW
jgi:hypothetical protein